MSDARRYILAPAGRGALLLDLASGALVELNESAAFIWGHFISGGDHSSIAHELAGRYAIDPELAASHVHHALRLPHETTPPPPTDLNYRVSDEDYIFEYRGRPTFRIDAGGDDIALERDAAVTPDSVRTLLHGVVPKILSLRGHFVLHAAAVAIGNDVLAFSGLSGAGKSTTARAFVAAGAQPVCDDQLLVETALKPARVPRGAEDAIDRWIAATAGTLLANRRARCAELDHAMDGEQLILAEVGFLDRDRRKGSDYSAAPIDPTSAAGALFRNAFHGSNQERYWTQAMERATRTADRVSAFLLTPPATIDALAHVAERRVAAGTLRP
ncbi:MAG TPA: PqqD family peptide modification chaperone [Polyangia bacterium]|nr:PqqD family peptide modification chaperone [Polyangia bacterium]